MNRYVIEVRTIPQKGDEAMALFQELKAYFKNEHHKTLEVFYQAFGAPGMFQAVVDFDNLSELEAISQAMRRDPQYKALSERASLVFDTEKMTTSVYYRV